MNLKDLKNRLNDAVETENPPDMDYYGAEVDANEVEQVRHRMDEGTASSTAEVVDESQPAPTPSVRRQGA